MSHELLTNVHQQLLPPTERGKSYITKNGDIIYYHYCCDKCNDIGWGCGYRTLQTLCAWLIQILHKTEEKVPSIKDIQETLVRIGDKTEDIVGSKQWIGALEVCYVVDALYNVPCKILHVPSVHNLYDYRNELKEYFENYGGFVMMGGDLDASSKGIAGIHIHKKDTYLLVFDPHFKEIPKSADELIEKKFIRWVHISEFIDSSFYNFCLPIIKENKS